MVGRRAALRSTGLVVALASVLLAGLACGGTAREDEGPVQAYTVRGEVVAVPGGGGPTDQLRIHHEAVPDFIGIDGDVVGMAPMTMPFPTADSVDVASLAPGDKVEFTFEVRWGGSPAYQISKLHKLPPDTQLTFRKVDTESGHDDPEHSGAASPDPHDADH